MAEEEEPKLKQNLRDWQILFIAGSGVIGSGIFSNDGEALEISGPGGTLLSLFVIGIIAICVMESLSELIQLFPAPNAIVEYIATFVDPDLGWIMGIAYWYTYASIFATQIITAANFSTYWHLAQVWQTLGFYVLAPLVILAINFSPVGIFGLIESIGGAAKGCLVLGSAILMYVIAGEDHNGDTSGYFNDGFTNNSGFAADHNTAVCYAIPLIAYSFLGIEIVAVTAFEAHNLRALRVPSRIIAYIVLLLYLLCAVGEMLNVKWTNLSLPTIYGGVGNSTISVHNSPSTPTSSMVMIATIQQGIANLPGVLNGCLIFSVLSASNTSLYVASRTLYGMTRNIPRRNVGLRFLRHISFVVPSTGVPLGAVIVSALAFFWLPFLQLRSGYAIQALVEIMSVSASVSCLLVWAALCLTHMRYQYWLGLCDDHLVDEYALYRRRNSKYQASTLLSRCQPLPASIGLVGCLIVTLGFTSATWWNGDATVSKVAVAYAAPIVLFTLWTTVKIIRAFKGVSEQGSYRPWIYMSGDFAPLAKRLRHLQWFKPEQRRSNNSGVQLSIIDPPGPDVAPVPPQIVEPQPNGPVGQAV